MHSTAEREKFALGEAEALQSSGFFDFDLFADVDVSFVGGVVVLVVRRRRGCEFRKRKTRWIPLGIETGTIECRLHFVRAQDLGWRKLVE